MPGGSFNHSSKTDEKNLSSKKITKNFNTKKSSGIKSDSKVDKAQPGKAINVNNDSSSTQPLAIKNEKPKQLQQQVTKKSLNFMKTCSSSNSISPSKLPPPPSPPTLSKINSKTFLKIENHDRDKEMCEAIAVISDNKRKSSVNSLKFQKSSLETNKSTPDSVCCTLCSSSDVNEITLKIKACQSCNNVSIDQINCSGQIMSSPNDIISTLTGQSQVNCNYQNQQPPPVSTVQQCYHHLTNITQKLRNMYKNQIHTSQSQSSSQRSSIVTIPEQDIPMEFFKTQQTDGKSPWSSSKHFHFSVKKTSSNIDQPQSEKQSNNSNINLISSKPNISSIFNNTNNISKSKNNPNKENSSKCNINGDVLVLKICDLDHSSNLSNKKHERMGKSVEATTALKLNNLNDFDQQKSTSINSSNNNNNNEISFIKKDCQHENFNLLRRQSSVDVATSPSLCSPAQEVTVFNLSPDEIKVEKVTSPAPITISPTYFSDNNKKLKISLKRNDSYQSGDSGKLSPSQLTFPKTSLSKGSCEKRSPKSQQLQKSPSGTNYQIKQNKIKMPRKTQSFQGDDIPTTDKSKNLVNKSYRKIMVMSEYNKDKNKMKSIKNSDFLNSNLNHRRSLMKKSKQQNSEISKSLDILLPSDILNDFSDLPDSFFNLPPYTLTSKSTSNLNAIVNDFDDDDEGPFEHINSVELIFISDEFLSRAVKHDLKIINCTTDLNEKIRSPIEIKVSKPNVSSTSSSKTSSKNKLQKGSSSTESKTIKTPDSVSGGSSRKNSISPSRPDKPLITKNLSDLNIGSKKLIVISEDFKRKSLENTVIIINQTEDDNIKPPYLGQHQELALKNLQNSKDRSPSECGTTINSSSDCIDDNLNANLKSNTKTNTTKRKNLKELKSWGRESSVDDVGNQMVSHAFCSAEEPDELCLENKEIVESIK